MTIRDTDRRRLHDLAGGQCSYPGCSERGFEEAHICAQSKGGPRYDPALSQDEIDSYSNLILLCANHHHYFIDDSDGQLFSTEKLREMKRNHEKEIALRLSPMTEFAGEVEARGQQTDEVVGARVRKPVRFKAGTRISARGENVGRVIGLEIGGSDG